MYLLATLLALFGSFPCKAQVNEQQVIFNGPSKQIIPSTPSTAPAFNSAYLFSVQPGTVAYIFITNDSATTGCGFNVALFSAGNTQLQSYLNNLGQFVLVPISTPLVASGAFQQSIISITLGALTTTGIQSNPIGGTRAVFTIVQTGGCSAASNVEVSIALQTTGSPAISSTASSGGGGSCAGTTVGSALTGNPCVDGGTDQSGNVRTARVLSAIGDVSSQVPGWIIGNPQTSPLAVATNHVTFPNGGAGGQLATLIYGPASDTGSINIPPGVTRGAQGGAETQPSGLATSTVGFTRTVAATQSSSGTFLSPLWGASGTGSADAGQFHGCFVVAITSTFTGTAPTLDVFIQVSNDGSNWTDRIHFAQFTATGKFYAGISDGSGGITPVAMQDGALAVATKVDGPIGAFGQVKFVIGGTPTNITYSIQVSCV